MTGAPWIWTSHMVAFLLFLSFPGRKGTCSLLCRVLWTGLVHMFNCVCLDWTQFWLEPNLAKIARVFFLKRVLPCGALGQTHADLHGQSCTEPFAQTNLHKSKLHRTTCADQSAQSHLRRVSCTEPFTHSEVARSARNDTCAEKLAQSRLLAQSHVRKEASSLGRQNQVKSLGKFGFCNLGDSSYDGDVKVGRSLRRVSVSGHSWNRG